MQFNEFNRRLNKCHLDQDTRIILSHMFEVQIEFSRQLDTAVKIVDQLVDAVQGFVSLHANTQEKLRQLMRGGIPDGVEVYSVRNEDEKD